MNLARRWTSPSSATVRWLLGVLPWIVAVTIALIAWGHASRSADVRLMNDGPIAFGTIASVDHDQPQVNYTHGIVGDVVADIDARDAHEVHGELNPEVHSQREEVGTPMAAKKAAAKKAPAKKAAAKKAPAKKAPAKKAAAKKAPAKKAAKKR